MDIFRLQRADFSCSKDSLGEGARRVRARWHSNSIPMIYATETSSLAILELLGHFVKLPLIRADYTLITFRCRDEISLKKTREKDLDLNWRSNFDYTRNYGNKWFDSMETCFLKVPSIHTPKESNILINPYHEDFERVEIVNQEPYIFNEKFM